MESKNVTAVLEGKWLTVQVDYPEETSAVLLKFDSARNRPVSRFSDRSPRDGERQVKVIRQDGRGDVYFPVVDLAVTADLYARAEFSGAEGEARYTFNSWLWPESAPAVGEVLIPGKCLLEWENGLFVTDRNTELTGFSLYREIPQPLTVSRRITKSVRLLTENWSGSVEAFYKKGGDYIRVGAAQVEAGAGGPRWENEPFIRSGEADFSRKTILNSLEMNLSYMLNSRIQSEHHPMAGGFYLFYDVDAGTYRTPAWLWGGGPSIAALVKSAGVSEMAGRFGREYLIEAAEKAGAVTLSGQVYHPSDPELDGLSTARWDPNLNMKGGYRQRICAASDSGFLCGWAWTTLYQTTGNKRFLDASLRYADSAERLVRQYGIPPQDYMPEEGCFTAHTLDESGFGVKAFEALYRLTGEERYRETGREYIDRHIEKFRRPDGLWERSYRRDGDFMEPSIFMTRGLGWAMEGLLSAWSLTGDKKYRDQAMEMADILLEKQNQDGSWNFMLNRTEEEAGLDEKGTPLWALLLYRLYGACGEARYLTGARNALAWCMRNQITDGAPECVGGLAGANPQSAVVYRPWFLHTCLYTAGFFALALLEELKLQS